MKPPCPKCGGSNTYLDDNRRSRIDEVYLACWTCGWRLYGLASIENFVMAFQQKQAAVQAEAERTAQEQKHQEQLARRRERDRRRREREREARSLQVVPSPPPLDPVLQLPWAPPDDPSATPCAWPPCTSAARATSKYCSRKCCVKVAHRRDKLRKKGILDIPARVAS